MQTDIVVLVDQEHAGLMEAMEYAEKRGLIVIKDTKEGFVNTYDKEILVFTMPVVGPREIMPYTLHFLWRMVRYPMFYDPKYTDSKFLVAQGPTGGWMINLKPRQSMNDALKNVKPLENVYIEHEVVLFKGSEDQHVIKDSTIYFSGIIKNERREAPNTRSALRT